MSSRIDEMSESFKVGYSRGVLDERRRIVRLIQREYGDAPWLDVPVHVLLEQIEDGTK